MDVSTPFGSQELKLGLRFDPFSGRDNVETTAESNHCAKNRHALLVRFQVADEGLINLDPVEWETAQIAE